MTICLNEREWAETALDEKHLGRKPAETINRIARYYAQCLNYKKKDIGPKIEEFMKQCNPSIVLVKWEDVIEAAVRDCNKARIIEVDCVCVSDKEMEVIKSVKGKQTQRLLVTMLCIAKYWNAARESNNNWVNATDREVMKMANVNTSTQRQNAMLKELKELGLIKFSKRVDNLNIQIQFIDEDAEVIEMVVDDFRNIGNQYLMYCGESFMKCVQCGITVRRKSNSQKHCPDCASEIYVRKSIESVMKKRVAPSAEICNFQNV